MKQLFYKILFSISLLIFLQNHSLAQNIFDDLKKAGEQIQKELNKPEVKPKTPNGMPVQTGPSQSPGKQSSQSPGKQVDTKTKTNVPNNFSLFGLKLGDPISSAKITNKQLENTKIIGRMTALRVGAHVTFEPKIKNDYFDSFFITYGPISKKIEGIYGRSKKTFKNTGDCSKASEDNFIFVAEKNSKDNPSISLTFDGEAGILTANIAVFTLPSKEEIIIYNFCNPTLYATPDYNWLAIFNSDREKLIITELEEYNAEKGAKEFQKKKDSGQLKGL
jgi:hypothetical protein